MTWSLLCLPTSQIREESVEDIDSRPHVHPFSLALAVVRCVFFPEQKIENKRTRELSEEELTQLREEVNKYTIEGDLVRWMLRAVTAVL